MNEIMSVEARQFVSFCRSKHWRSDVLPETGMVYTSVFENERWYEPYNPSIIIPKKAQKRREVILKSGLPIQGFILAHEVTHELANPVQPQPKVIPWKKIGTIAGAIAVVATLIVALPAVLGTVAVAGTAAVVDPQLIAVLPDGTRIVVATWYNR